MLARAGLNRVDIAQLAVVEIVSVGLGAFRLALTLASLNIAVSAAEVIAVGASGALSVAAGIVPAGLGVREVLAALLGDVVGLGASESVVATAMDRAVGLVGLIPAVGVAIWLRGREADGVGQT